MNVVGYITTCDIYVPPFVIEGVRTLVARNPNFELVMKNFTAFHIESIIK